MDRLGALQVFVRVVESGSFSAVARERSTTQSTISKQIAALEDYLGVKLLSRSTRALSLTEAGERYFEEARRLVAEFGAAEDLVRRGARQLTVWLKVATSVGYGRRVLMPRVMAFLNDHPAVRIDLNLNDGFIDLIESGIDVAIRLGNLSDSSLIARRIGSSRRLLLCARSYADRIGAALPDLSCPEDLKHHNCIGYTELPTQNSWEFRGPDNKAISVRISGNLRSNSSEAIRAAALTGMGICYVPDWLFEPEIATGEMVALLPQWTTTHIPITAVTPAHTRKVAKIETFIGFLTA
jgi:DNA-binding transcriptional LysR family regulator